MKIKHSPLQLEASILRALSIKIFLPKNGIKQPFSMSNYSLNLEFDILEPKEDDNFLVRIRLSVNSEGKKKPGYVISVETRYIFTLAANNLDEKTIQNLKGLSAVSIAIAKLRSELERITESYQFGTYHLPSIDMQNLFEQKKLQVTGSK